MDVKDIQEQIKAAKIDSLRIDFPDLHGICRSKLVPAGRLEEVLEEGCNHVQATYAIDFANDVAMGTGAGDEIQWRDMTIKPDLDTFAVLPHLEGTARFIGNAYGPDGKEIKGSVVAADGVGAGVGEVVLYATGSAARQTTATHERPCDAVIMAIVDNWEVGGKEVFRK